MGIMLKDFIGHIAHRGEPIIQVHGPGEEYLELTGTVFANWIYKAAHLLSDYDLKKQRPLGLVCDDRGLHWRALTAMFGAWALGSPVALLTADAQVGHSWIGLAADDTPPEASHTAEELFVFARGGLALTSDATEALDFIAEARSQGDFYPIPEDVPQPSIMEIGESGFPFHFPIVIPPLHDSPTASSTSPIATSKEKPQNSSMVIRDSFDIQEVCHQLVHGHVSLQA